MSNSRVIFGAGRFTHVMIDVVDAINGMAPIWDMLGFIVDAQYERQSAVVLVIARRR